MKLAEKQQEAERIANALSRRRVLLNKAGDQQGDRKTAEKLVKNPLKKWLFRLNGPLVGMESRSSLFEAIGVLLIPVAIAVATFAYENQRDIQANERLQQETIQNYINQISEILLNVEGDLRSPENQRIRTIMTATTFTLMNDPILNGKRRGQVIGFLKQMELIQNSENTEGNLEQDAIIKLTGFNLSGADLIFDELSNVNMSGANLSNTDLYAVKFRGTDLSNATLSSADLSNATLRGADLSGANLNGAILTGTDLYKADFDNADLSNAKLFDAKTHFPFNRNAQYWTDEQLGKAHLCKTKLPEGSSLKPDRDCARLWIPE